MILFEFSESIQPELPVDLKLLEAWLMRCARRHRYEISFVRYYFTDNREIVQINREVFNRTYPTDVISLYIPIFSQKLNGEIFISIEQVVENSREYQVEYGMEFLRVAVHGLLHLCGYDDQTEEQRLLMRRYEDECLSLFS